MKKLLCAILSAAVLAGCSAPAVVTEPPASITTEDFETKWADSGFARIALNDGLSSVTLPEGMATDAVTLANDIIYYEEGHDASYGEGEKGEAHSADEAARHTVVHINAPGTYVLTGKLSAGQVAIDLGEDAENDPTAVVTLILDSVDITCTVAPAIIFYNVYECGDAENPSATVDTSAAGANVILPEGSINYVNGSHVAKIYKPGTEKKLHKYDGAFYSRMSMNVGGEGFLMITADNEGLDSELHLTINGGMIYIKSGNDGINTNEDGVSVTTINGGTLRIDVTGTTGEGDGIDSNGWLVINGGNVFAYACGSSMDSGIDSDMGIRINGGTVVATGNMLDRIDDGSQTHAVFSFAQNQQGGTYALKNEKGTAIFEFEAPNGFSNLILSSPALVDGSYTLWCGGTQFAGMAGSGGGFGGGFGGFIGGGFEGAQPPIEFPGQPGKGGGGDVEIPPQPTQPIYTQGQPGENGAPPEGFNFTFIPQGGEGMPVPSMPQGSEDMPVPPMPQGSEAMPPMPGNPGGGRQPSQSFQIIGQLSTEFPITRGANYFSFLQIAN